MPALTLPIALDEARLARFCRERGIGRLTVFGSVLRDDFNPARSDVDVFAEFLPGALRGVGLRYFDYASDLGAIFGHRVDFCAQLPPEIRERVQTEGLVVYERA